MNRWISAGACFTQGAVERLSKSCARMMLEFDIDKVVMLHMERKDFFIDEQTLLAVQPQIQWLADLAMYLLTSLPGAQGSVSTD